MRFTPVPEEQFTRTVVAAAAEVVANTNSKNCAVHRVIQRRPCSELLTLDHMKTGTIPNNRELDTTLIMEINKFNIKSCFYY